VSIKLVIPRQQAHRDVDDILAYFLEQASPAVALAFVDAIEGAYRHLGQAPASGSPRYAHELNLPGLRCWRLEAYPYLIFYVDQPEAIDVWRVLHAQRDIPAWLEKDVY
jgi:toxin ParE1/3/4